MPPGNFSFYLTPRVQDLPSNVPSEFRGLSEGCPREKKSSRCERNSNKPRSNVQRTQRKKTARSSKLTERRVRSRRLIRPRCNKREINYFDCVLVVVYCSISEKLESAIQFREIETWFCSFSEKSGTLVLRQLNMVPVREMPKKSLPFSLLLDLRRRGIRVPMEIQVRIMYLKEVAENRDIKDWAMMQIRGTTVCGVFKMAHDCGEYGWRTRHQRVQNLRMASQNIACHWCNKCLREMLTIGMRAQTSGNQPECPPTLLLLLLQKYASQKQTSIKGFLTYKRSLFCVPTNSSGLQDTRWPATHIVPGIPLMEERRKNNIFPFGSVGENSSREREIAVASRQNTAQY